MTVRVRGSRTALVVGGSSGIGAAIAYRLGEAGFRLALTYSSNRSGAEQIVTRFANTSGGHLALHADVADVEEVAAAFDSVEQRLDGIDVVVHTPCRVVPAAIVDVDLDDLDVQYRANIRGAFAVVQQALRRLRDGGSLIAISSGVVGSYPPSWAAYAAAKAALEALTMVAAKEVRGRDINVNVLAPGPTATNAFLESASPERVEHLAASSLLGRLGRPEEVAEVVGFLASPEGHWVNGQTIHADGGFI